MTTKNWNTSNIPRRKEGLAVVTGSTEGVGFEGAKALTSAGWTVVMLGRNPQKGAESIKKIKQTNPNAKISFEKLDLADLSSIEAFANKMIEKGQAINLLVNNAGVMTPPKRIETKDGFELQFGTNYLGHFALTAQLLPLLRKTEDARVVTLSSVAAREGKINFDDLQSESSYKPMVAYGQSKLADLMFAFELQRQSVKNNWGITSIAAHPGVTRTNLLITGAGRWSVMGMARTLLPFMFQEPAQGALPTLFAATSPDAKGGLYYGPDKMDEIRGFPAIAKVPSQAEDENVASKLWKESLQLTKVQF